MSKLKPFWEQRADEDNIFHLPVDPKVRAEIFNRYLPPLSKEDNAILIARLRLLAADAVTLKAMAALIPSAASMVRHAHVEELFVRDLKFCLFWMEDHNPSLEELSLISEIIAKWDANHCRTNPYWNPHPSPVEAALNRRILAVCERLKMKGQYTVEEDTNGHCEE
jgi:hypothetical protein